MLETINVENNLSEEFKEKIGKIIRKLHNTNDIALNESNNLFTELEEKSKHEELTEKGTSD